MDDSRIIFSSSYSCGSSFFVFFFGSSFVFFVGSAFVSSFGPAFVVVFCFAFVFVYCFTFVFVLCFLAAATVFLPLRFVLPFVLCGQSLRQGGGGYWSAHLASVG